MKAFVLIIISIASSTWACSISKLPRDLMMGNIISEQRVSYINSAGLLDSSPSYTISNCREFSRSKKWIMIASGPENIGLRDNITSFSFNLDKEIEPESCTIKESTLSSDYFERKIERFNKNKNFIKQCLKIRVRNLGRVPLKFPKKQIGCDFKKIDKSTFEFAGGFCYFRPGFDANIAVSLSLKEECSDEKFNKEMNLSLIDTNMLVNTYSSGDTSGKSSDLTALSSSEFRLISTQRKPLPMSVPYWEEGIYFPSQYVMPSIELGKVDFRPSGQNLNINTPFVVEPSCEKKCNNDKCSTSCDFQHPLVAEITLKKYNVKNKKYEYLDTWYDGNVMSSQYKGMVMGKGKTIPETLIESGAFYSLDFNFGDPKFSFEMFKNKIKSLTGTFNRRFGQITNGRVPKIPSVSHIPESRKLPEIDRVRGLRFNGGNLTGVTSALRRLRKYISYSNWPNYYDDFCFNQSCQKMNDYNLRMTLQFSIEKYFDEDEEENRYRLKNKKITIKQGKKLVSERLINKMPYYFCER